MWVGVRQSAWDEIKRRAVGRCTVDRGRWAGKKECKPGPIHQVRASDRPRRNNERSHWGSVGLTRTKEVETNDEKGWGDWRSLEVWEGDGLGL